MATCVGKIHTQTKIRSKPTTRLVSMHYSACAQRALATCWRRFSAAWRELSSRRSSHQQLNPFELESHHHHHHLSSSSSNNISYIIYYYYIVKIEPKRPTSLEGRTVTQQLLIIIIIFFFRLSSFYYY